MDYNRDPSMTPFVGRKRATVTVTVALVIVVGLGIVWIRGLHEQDLTVAQRKQHHPAAPIVWPKSAVSEAKPGPAALPDLQRLRDLADDSALPPERRIEALRELQPFPEARTPDVVDSVLGLAAGLDSPAEQAAILEGVDGAVTSAPQRRLVARFLGPSFDTDVRFEAARALSGLASDAAVHEALVRAAETDASPRVRDVARLGLEAPAGTH